MFKRGVSPVVATVLLLVITVVIASIIFAFVVPFVNKSLGNSKVCLDVLDGVEFPESRFNCYNVSSDISNVPTGWETGFSVKIKKNGVYGFRVALIDENEQSIVKDINPGGLDESVFRMVGSQYGPPLGVPSVGGQKTYVANEKYAKAEVSPMTESGDVCPVADVVEFTQCAREAVFSTSTP